MISRLRSLLLPAEPRSLPGRRGIKIVLRAVHVLCAGILTGSYVLDANPDLRTAWLAYTIATGSAILLLDLHETAAFLLQVRGLFVVAKIAALWCLPWFGGSQGWVLAGLIVLSVVFSHAPSGVRYRVVFGRGSVRGAASRG